LFNGAFQFLPFAVTLVDATGIRFGTNVRDGRQNQRTDVPEGSGTFSGDAVVSEKRPELREGAIEIGERLKIAGGRGELGTDAIRFEKDAFLACVEEAERGMRVVAKHGAAAIV